MTQTPHDAPPAGGEPQGGRFRREGVHDLGALRRSVTDRKLAGVAGGLGRHFNIDPTVLRVAFVVLTLFGGAGALLYALAYLVVPEEGSDRAVITTNPSTRATVLIVAGVLAVALVVSNAFGHWWFPWPLAVVGVVVLLIWMNRDKKMNSSPPPPAPPTGKTPASQPAAGGWTDEDYVVPPPPPPYYGPTPGYQPPPRRTDRGPKLFAPTLALLAVALGALGLYDVLGGPVVAAAYPALALAVIGGMLLVGAWIGRAGGLILLGLAATVALAGTSIAGAPFGSGRHIDATPASASAVRDQYFLPSGRIRVDLTHLADPAALDGRTITARTRAGEIVVLLPQDIRAHVVADVSLGQVLVDGQQTGGANARLVRDLGTGPTTVDLDLSASVGRVEVREVPALSGNPTEPSPIQPSPIQPSPNQPSAVQSSVGINRGAA